MSGALTVAFTTLGCRLNQVESQELRALVEHAGGFHPPEDVATSIGARHPHVFADGKGDLPSAAVDLVGELQAGGRSTDDEHAAVVELVG